MAPGRWRTGRGGEEASTGGRRRGADARGAAHGALERRSSARRTGGPRLQSSEAWQLVQRAREQSKEEGRVGALKWGPAAEGSAGNWCCLLKSILSSEFRPNRVFARLCTECWISALRSES